MITASAAGPAASAVAALPSVPPPGRRMLWAPAQRFLVGRAVSNCGDWLTTVAVAVALYSLTGSLAAPAVAMLLRVAPRPFGALAGGHLADRFGPMPTLVALNLGRAAATGLLAVALGARAIPAALIFLVVSQAAGAAAQPAGQAALPQLVPAAALGRTTARIGLIDSLSLVVGPGIATALLSVAGGDWVWLVSADAISFLILAGLLATLPVDVSPAPAGRSGCSATPGCWREALPPPSWPIGLAGQPSCWRCAPSERWPSPRVGTRPAGSIPPHMARPAREDIGSDACEMAS